VVVYPARKAHLFLIISDVEIQNGWPELWRAQKGMPRGREAMARLRNGCRNPDRLEQCPRRLFSSDNVRSTAHSRLTEDIAPCRKVPKPKVAASFDHLRGRFGKITSSTWNDSPAPAFVLATHPRPQKESLGVELQCPRHLPPSRL
jgi:hypothetical protein